MKYVIAESTKNAIARYRIKENRLSMLIAHTLNSNYAQPGLPILQYDNSTFSTAQKDKLRLSDAN